MGASPPIYDTLISGGIGHVLVQILRENLDSALLDRTLHAIHHILRDRVERRPYTLAILHRVGLVNELLKIAAQKNGGFDLNLVSYYFHIKRYKYFVRFERNHIRY